MKKVLLILIFLSSFLFGQEIEWSENYKLQLSDFKGKIVPSENAAVSMVGINYKVLSTSIWTGKIKLKIYATFNPEISWFKKEFSYQKNILEHEQLHFDIAEVFARKMSKRITQDIKNAKDFNQNFQSLFDEIYSEYFDFQTLFEFETSHGTNLEKNKEWKNKIENMLKN